MSWFVSIVLRTAAQLTSFACARLVHLVASPAQPGKPGASASQHKVKQHILQLQLLLLLPPLLLQLLNPSECRFFCCSALTALAVHHHGVGGAGAALGGGHGATRADGVLRAGAAAARVACTPGVAAGIAGGAGCGTAMDSKQPGQVRQGVQLKGRCVL